MVPRWVIIVAVIYLVVWAVGCVFAYQKSREAFEITFAAMGIAALVLAIGIGLIAGGHISIKGISEYISKIPESLPKVSPKK